MKRRTILTGLGSLGLAACRPGTSDSLAVTFLARSLPTQILSSFRRQTPTRFESELSLTTIYSRLQEWQVRSAPPLPLWRRLLPLDLPDQEPASQIPSLVSLSDPWLQYAVEQQLLQPLNLSGAIDLADDWQRLLRGKSADQSFEDTPLWGFPYRVQGLMVAYQKPILKRRGLTITKWADLWQPELRQRIAMPAHPRLVMSVALMALGYSVNDEAAIASEEVRRQCQQLIRQVRLFDSESYLKALVNEDVWLGVGWSGDILATQVRYRRLGSVYPQEGTVLTADLWCAPAKAAIATATQDWLDYCWQQDIAAQISISTYGLSPAFLQNEGTVPQVLKSRGLLSRPRQIPLKLSRAAEQVMVELFRQTSAI